jgi:hypothetical protein
VTYPKQLVRLSPKGGFVSDVDPAEVGNDYFTGISNVIFRNSYAKRIAGNRSTYTTALATAAPTQLVHAINTEQSGTNYWLLFEDDGTAWAIEGNNATQIDNTLLTSVGDPYKHSSGSLNGVPIYSNSTDEPVYWAGANVVTLTDWTATESCKFITVFKYHIFAMDISGPGGTFPNLAMHQVPCCARIHCVTCWCFTSAVPCMVPSMLVAITSSISASCNPAVDA